MEHEEEVERTRGKLVLNVALGALNTLAAVAEVGKPRWLFDMLHKEPDGAVMAKYKEFGYAMDAMHKPSPDPHARELPTDMRTWCIRLWKGVALQLLMSFVIMAFAGAVFYFVGPDMEELERRLAGGAAAAADAAAGRGATPQIPLRPPEPDDEWDREL
eukprot:1874126-Prymnesium_polylepis.1